MSVYRLLEVVEGSGFEFSSDPCHWEGYVPLSRHYCYRLFRQGRVRLREFVCERSGSRYSVPETANDLIVDLGDLVVLERERVRFEESYGLRPTIDSFGMSDSRPASVVKESKKYLADSGLKIIKRGEREYRLGDMQAAILRELYVKAREGEPWQSGKLLLRDVGSQSFSLSNVFKRNPIWREIVLSDGRGSYRMNTRSIDVRSD